MNDNELGGLYFNYPLTGGDGSSNLNVEFQKDVIRCLVRIAKSLETIAGTADADYQSRLAAMAKSDSALQSALNLNATLSEKFKADTEATKLANLEKVKNAGNS